MLNILLITTRGENLRAFVEGISEDPQVRLEQAAAAAQALERVRTAAPHLVIVDSTTEGLDWLEVVRRIIGVNAMANTAVVSSLSDADFHDRGEGLGILCRLPPAPGAEDAKSLLEKLRGLTGAV